LSKINEYLTIIATETFPSESNADWQSVPEEWEEEQPERYKRVVKALHSLADDIVELHGQLVRHGRSYLVE